MKQGKRTSYKPSTKDVPSGREDSASGRTPRAASTKRTRAPSYTRSRTASIAGDVLRLYVEEGRSARAIARTLGVSVNLVSRALVENDAARLKHELLYNSRAQLLELRILLSSQIEAISTRRRSGGLLASLEEWKLLDVAARLIERLDDEPNRFRSFIRFANGLALRAKRDGRGHEFCEELADTIAGYGESLREETEFADDGAR